jgi:predicted phage replisome organizer
MADVKKYYYMRLKENFFDSEEMVVLESMQDGMLYSNILIKMYLKSLKANGMLMFKDTIPYNPTMIATITRHQVGTVEKALQLFEQLGLIEVLDNGAIYMNDIELFIGKTSTEGERKKAARMKIEQVKNEQITFSGQMSGQMSDKRTPELELELELELEKEKEKKIKTVQQVEQNQIDEQFETWWKLYPRKMDKKAAKTKFKTAIKNNSFEVIMNGTKEYNEYITFNNTQKEYIKLATTFLNQESFLNDYKELMIHKQRINNYVHQPYVSQSHQQAFYGIEEEKEIIEVNLEELPF